MPGVPFDDGQIYFYTLTNRHTFISVVMSSLRLVAGQPVAGVRKDHHKHRPTTIFGTVADTSVDGEIKVLCFDARQYEFTEVAGLYVRDWRDLPQGKLVSFKMQDDNSWVYENQFKVKYVLEAFSFTTKYAD
jgi:hypothetical protein